MIQRNLFETLRRVKQPDPELSPRWRGQAIVAAVAGFKVPVWSVAAIAAVALLGVYFVFRALLSGNAEAAATALLSVHPKGEIGIMRKVFSAPPASWRSFALISSHCCLTCFGVSDAFPSASKMCG